MSVEQKTVINIHAKFEQVRQRRHLICSRLSCHAIPSEQTMSLSRVYAWHKSVDEAEERVNTLKLRVS